ncbi:AAA family ATPase [Rhodobacteraceae bacterium SC52]|nr:AAA family ATPase [Rhodobacteraceae bacterium SC52]
MASQQAQARREYPTVGRDHSHGFEPASTLDGEPIPPRDWLVPDLVPSGTVTLLGGDGGTGKSLLALQLATAVATGRQWLRHDVKAGAAVYMSAEDDRAELHRRLADIARAEDANLTDFDRLLFRSLAGDDALLALLDRSGLLQPTPLYEALDAYLSDVAPVLVVLDTLADLFPGNENDRAQARQFVGMLRGLAIRHSCAVVMLAHPSLSGLNSGSGTSGSTGWNNSVRSRLYLERIKEENHEPDPDARILRTMKANYGRIGGEISMRWKSGVFVADEAETRLDRLSRNAKAERVFLKLLDEFSAEGRRVRPSTGAGYAPHMFAKSGRAEGVGKAALHSAMEAMFAKGAIVMAEEGPPSRRVRFIERASK